MKARDLKALVKALKEAGVTHFRDGDLELKLGNAPEPAPSPRVEQPAHVPGELENIPHHSEQLHSLRKISDEELVNSLFPDHRPEASEA